MSKKSKSLRWNQLGEDAVETVEMTQNNLEYFTNLVDKSSGRI